MMKCVYGIEKDEVYGAYVERVYAVFLLYHVYNNNPESNKAWCETRQIRNNCTLTNTLE